LAEAVQNANRSKTKAAVWESSSADFHIFYIFLQIKLDKQSLIGGYCYALEFFQQPFIDIFFNCP
ncbi:MAG: hypothetical protein IKD10_12205, partial [Lentisphaeria bacterium]|nr:hypothetical protein [Lentisphaeria bacterium]